MEADTSKTQVNVGTEKVPTPQVTPVAGIAKIKLQVLVRHEAGSRIERLVYRRLRQLHPWQHIAYVQKQNTMRMLFFVMAGRALVTPGPDTPLSANVIRSVSRSR